MSDHHPSAAAINEAKDRYDRVFAPMAEHFTPKALMAEYAPFRRARNFLLSTKEERSPHHLDLIDQWDRWNGFLSNDADLPAHPPIVSDLRNITGRKATDRQAAALLAAVIDDGRIPKIAGIEPEFLKTLVSHHRIADGSSMGLTVCGGGHSTALGRNLLTDDPTVERWMFFTPHSRLLEEFMERDPHTLYEWKIALVRRQRDVSDDPRDVLAFVSGIAIDPTAARDPRWIFAEANEQDAWDDYRRLALRHAAKAERMSSRLFLEMSGLASALHVRRLWIAPAERGRDRLVQLLSSMREVLYAGYSRVDGQGRRMYGDDDVVDHEMEEITGQSSTFGFELPYIPRKKSDRPARNALDAMRRLQWLPKLERHITACAKKAHAHVVYWPDDGS